MGDSTRVAQRDNRARKIKSVLAIYLVMLRASAKLMQVYLDIARSAMENCEHCVILGVRNAVEGRHQISTFVIFRVVPLRS